MRVLVVTAVPHERDAVTGAAGWPPRPVGLPGTAEAHRVVLDGPEGAGAELDVLVAGVGPAAAAAGAATALTAADLAGAPYELVVSAGIGGGIGVAPGRIVVATALVAADLGAETAEGFRPVTGLGFGTSVHRPPPEPVRELAEAVGGVTGPVLTVSTVTGTARGAAELVRRHPGAVAEAMEGFGVAEAAAAFGVPALEVRAVSNAVGPRDRAAWRVPEALAALGDAFRAAAPLLETWTRSRTKWRTTHG
ncbi:MULTISPECIES: futalosine hydrolase [unclassified Streptomyces]|uniref:futalosine hydrolase n=1 Tax=unclassified Streptomyces TaxID=2593676 RepID=UPI0022B6C834|nr:MULTISPECIES: futalosine hydrolase [unclassified Streptomyces]MCZ7414891.1 futalosine hydrolase [Streptomyces sp. WMMC897]MCZ7431834.1 futalosine hydrolase [Streptomyces sp. WMMC1477]